MRFVVVDTELTSLESRTNRLLSIGAIAMRGSSITLGEQFYRIVNPQIEIPADSVVIHRIRGQDLESAAPISNTLGEFQQFIAGSVLIAHHATIDLQILRKEMRQSGHALSNPVVDTVRVHQWLLRHGRYSEDLPVLLEKVDLATLSKFYAIEMNDHHHALSDAFATSRLWQKMFFRLQKHRVNDLKKLLKIAGL